jgi:ammonia channel protein AmtB
MEEKRMLRMILGVVAGFVVWSFLWLGLDTLLAAISPGWFGKNFSEFQNAVSRNEPFMSPASVSTYLVFQSVLCSLIAGFAAAAIAKESRKTALALGVLLLLTGIFVEAAHWNYFPIWYHLLFLALLIPITVLGGKLRRTEN